MVQCLPWLCSEQSLDQTPCAHKPSHACPVCRWLCGESSSDLTRYAHTSNHVSPVCRWLCSGRSSDLGRCSVEGAFELDCLAYTMRLAEERGCNCSFEVKPVDGLPAARQQNRWADTCLAWSAQSLGETVHCAAKGGNWRGRWGLQSCCEGSALQLTGICSRLI